jgi:hypothetical protein
MFSSKRLQSGNHGRSSTETEPSSGVGGLVPSAVPLQSTRGFVAPATIPVKKTPDIMDIIGEKKVSDDEMIRRLDDEMINNTEEQSSSNHLITSSSNHLTVSEQNQNTFHGRWRAMFDQVFASVPTVFFTLKDNLPEIENNVIKFVVKNEIQKDHFESKSREVLEYLRTHYSEEIEDIVVETNELLETKKIIYDVKDKLQNFKEENEEFEDFIQILELKIKD